ncbi:MAG: hypothetical protein OXN21_06910 [Chloroflexota bacterium]|nr:hypothetical protein [Chloroflexota bacterium]
MLMTFEFDQLITLFLPSAIGVTGYALFLVGFLMLTRQALRFLGPMDSVLRMNIGKRIRLAAWVMGAGLALLVLREILLFVVVTLAVAGVAVGVGAFWSYEERNGPVTTFASSGDVVAVAGKVSISVGELQEAVMHLQHSKLMAEGALQRRLHAEIGHPIDYQEDLRNLGLKYGDDNVALAGLIHDHILYQKAVELGYEPTAEEVEANIEWARDAYKRGQWGEYNQGWIESVGEDHYFENIYPALVTRSMATEKLHQRLGQEVEARYYEGELPLRYQFEEAVLAKAEITVLESEEHSATLDGVLGYLAELRETDIAHWQSKRSPSTGDISDGP